MDRVGNVVKLPVRRSRTPRALRPSTVQRSWLLRGLDQPGGKLPLFDSDGRRVDPRTIKSCIENGWAEPWFHNPLKPDWLVCKLTEAGRNVLQAR
ncbi:MAG TPA: hypothetical protein VKY65_17465 [Alphaproteobacteria bacterium]|nr:hypothetical protein [Alphaproteobacteria bacterium]